VSHDGNVENKPGDSSSQPVDDPHRSRIAAMRKALDNDVVDPMQLAEKGGAHHQRRSTRDYQEEKPPHHGD
jgi:hypothetical protein